MDNIKLIATKYKLLTDTWHQNGLELFDYDRVANDLTISPAILMKLHWANYQIWHHEDYCRSGVPDLIVTHKQHIDKLNQIRNDLIEEIDEEIIKHQHGRGPYITDTPGSVTDRLSVLALKVYHWTELVIAGQQKFADKLKIAEDQFNFLAEELPRLFDNLVAGLCQFKLFKQLKMYNSNETNPHIQIK